MVSLTRRLVNLIDQKGRRVTAENSYLTPEVLKRPNLSVLVSAAVTKVTFDKSGDQPRAVGVEFTTSRDGPIFKARAEKEVILWWVFYCLGFCGNQVDFVHSAGAIHTPHVGDLAFSFPVSPALTLTYRF